MTTYVIEMWERKGGKKIQIEHRDLDKEYRRYDAAIRAIEKHLTKDRVATLHFSSSTEDGYKKITKKGNEIIHSLYTITHRYK